MQMDLWENDLGCLFIFKERRGERERGVEVERGGGR